MLLSYLVNPAPKYKPTIADTMWYLMVLLQILVRTSIYFFSCTKINQSQFVFLCILHIRLLQGRTLQPTCNTIIAKTADNAISLRVHAKCLSFFPALRASAAKLAFALARSMSILFCSCFIFMLCPKWTLLTKTVS